MADQLNPSTSWDSPSKRSSMKKEDDDDFYLSPSASSTSSPPQSTIKALIRSSPSTMPDTPSSPINLEKLHVTMKMLNDQLEDAKDVEFRLRLENNTTHQELVLALEKKEMYHRNSIESIQKVNELVHSLETTETKLIQVKEINVCLRLKHDEYERSLQVLSANVRTEKKLRDEMSLIVRKEAEENKREREEREEEMKMLKNDLNNVRDMMSVLKSEVEQKNSRMLGSFVVGVSVGLVSFLLPKRFIGN